MTPPRRKRFLIDVDDVLADFVTRGESLVSDALGRPWTIAEATHHTWDMFGGLDPKHAESVFKAMDAPGFCRGLPVAEGAREAIQRIQRFADVYIVTSPHHSPHWVYERSEWLAEHFGIERSHVVHTKAKYVVSGDYFLDDHPDNVRSWQKAHPHGKAMLWTTRSNVRCLGFDDARVRSWDEVFEQITEVVCYGHNTYFSGGIGPICGGRGNKLLPRGEGFDPEINRWCWYCTAHLATPPTPREPQPDPSRFECPRCASKETAWFSKEEIQANFYHAWDRRCLSCKHEGTWKTFTPEGKPRDTSTDPIPF